MASLLLDKIEVKKNILEHEKYKYVFSVEEVNKLVLKGVPFREAYQTIGRQIENGNFNYQSKINHNHEGSIGNLGNTDIALYKEMLVKQFPFEPVSKALGQLIQPNH